MRSLHAEVAALRTLLALALLLAAPGALAEDPPPRPGEVRLYLRDGSSAVGVVVERGDEAYVLSTPSGERARVAADQIREIVLLGPEVERPASPDLDPTRFRYLTSPSALALPRGSFALSATQPGQLTGSYAPLEHLSLSAGTAAPVLYLRGEAGNAVASLQGNWSFLPWLHAQAGVEVRIWASRQVGYLVGELTFGGPALHATVHGGPSPFGAWRQGFGDTSLSVNGLARLRPGVALVTESWLRSDGGLGAMNALAARLYTRRLSADLGLVRLARGGVMPWVGLSFAQDARRDLDL